VILREKERRALSMVPPADVKAYEYYLRGRQFLHQSRKKSFEYARQMFARAIEIDPEYALAYAGVASSSALIHMYYPTSEGTLEQADRASLRALELDPELAEAHAARGLALFLMKQLDQAEFEFKTAMRLDPNQYEARYFYARACFQQGKLAAAARLFEEASEVREDYQASFFAAQSHEALGDEAEAEAGYRRALAVVEKHMELNPDDPRAATMRAVSLCRLGQQEQGLYWAERALAIDPEDAGVRYNVACLYALEGMADKAISCLEDAIRVGFGNRFATTPASRPCSPASDRVLIPHLFAPTESQRCGELCCTRTLEGNPLCQSHRITIISSMPAAEPTQRSFAASNKLRVRD
jgi:adenylate cyclase